VNDWFRICGLGETVVAHHILKALYPIHQTVNATPPTYALVERIHQIVVAHHILHVDELLLPLLDPLDLVFGFKV
jgi:hypothetical protein